MLAGQYQGLVVVINALLGLTYESFDLRVTAKTGAPRGIVLTGNAIYRLVG